MARVAFFWVGQDVSIPQSLVHSARLVNGDQVEIIQLSDQNTPNIPGVDTVLRGALSKDIMVARLQAYTLVDIGNDFTFFCDADSLFINPVRITSQADILLSPRVLDFMINHEWPEHYPEFQGRMFSEVMPFLFGAIAVRRKGDFFHHLLSICEQLPARFHRWYGDQVALALAVKAGAVEYDLLEPEIYLNILKEAPSVVDLKMMKEAGTQMITFKGPATDKKTNLELSLQRLLHL